jgi:signal peptidase I
VTGTGADSGYRTPGVETEPMDDRDPRSAPADPDGGVGPDSARSDEAPWDDDGDDSTVVRRGALGRGAKALFDWALVVAIALGVALLVRGFVLAHFVVEGSSMYSTLTTGDRVFVNKLSYRFGEPSRGEVVVLHEIRGTAERDLIKRVIALPGEEIEVRSCEVRIDGRLLVEPYLDPTVVTPGNCGGDFGPLEIPADSVFVMGDNRAGSQDSRALGPIPVGDIVGRAFVVFWPRADWRWL